MDAVAAWGNQALAFSQRHAREATDTQWAVAVAAIVATAFAAKTLCRGKPAGPTKGPRRLRATSIGSSKFMCTGTTTLPDYDTIINICCRLDPFPNVDRLKRDFADEILLHQRFRSIPYQARPLAEIQWLPQRVDLGKHFIQHDVPSEAAARTLIDHISNALLANDKATHPWWEVHLIRMAGIAHGFVIIRVHHALADGVSLTEAFAPLIRDERGTPLDLSDAFNPKHLQKKAPKANPLVRAIRAVGFGASFVVEALRVMGGAVLPGDKPNRFCHNQWPWAGKRVNVFLPSHKVSLVKALKDKAGKGTTVNDVEFALFAGALRRYLQKHDKIVDVDKVVMRALTPLALLEKSDPLTKYSTMLRNLFTFVVNTLPVAQKTPVERLRASNRSWSHLKTSANVPAAFAVHRLTAQLPLAVQRQTVIDLFTRHSVVFSNVPGPQGRCFLAGSELTAVHMLYPNFTPQVGILSLNGVVHVAVSMLPDKDVDVKTELPRCFQAELEALCNDLSVPLDA